MCFLINKNFDGNKKNYIYDRFIVSNRNFTTEQVEIVKNSRFFQVF